MTAKSRSLTIAKRGLMSFETIMWVFTRLSALGMYALILFGLIGALIMGAINHMNFADIMRWAFTPDIAHVKNTNLPAIAAWAAPVWRLTASALVIIAVGHGVHGLVVIADDYIASDRGRRIVRFCSIVMILFMIGIGLYLIWTS
jgi:succinate dehydrogenase hydrophobic anchor subunit